ncbi:PEP-CTERM sorting domain-containing protein [Roseibacillus ishigakijimensis]|uniref:PEP-CTERM sorting domain-containing protein n=1 Tax=Roseibacillus ishigakijimensis TaxID=454146 RepID=A0A934RLR3_9BACT|nr:PEP-CTERM sorting domain-containing protein [Roseibacillus ishigakijimensis]MBK1833714.1 PEP-CTERM sorting domain-containing protein [Roseibacillus ishigakijimensis]
MKITIQKLVFAASVFAMPAYAVTTFTPTNASTTQGFAFQVVDNTGEPVTDAQVQVGYFNGEANSLANFVSLGSANFTSSPLGPGLFGALGGESIDINLKPGANDAALGMLAYAVVVNPNDSADTSFIAFTDNSTRFTVESVDVDGAAQSIFSNETNLVWGTVREGETKNLGGPFASRNGGNAVTFFVIPEPSSALLAGLALVGGLVRRRR